MSDSNGSNQVDFSGLILGFCSAALSYMGFGANSDEKNLVLARQNIDILDVLAEKTKGNLSSQEDQLLREVLRDLKLKFVEMSQNS